MRARPRGAPGSPLVLLVALAIFVWLTLDVVLGGPLTRLDHSVSAWARTTGIPGVGWKRPGQMQADAVVNFGDREVVGLIALLVVGYLSVRARTIAPLVRLVVLAGAAASIVLAFKYGIGRHAPSGVHGPEAFRSYPSGHMATAVILWGAVYSVVADYPDFGVSKPVAWLLSWFGPLLVMIGMVLRDYHWVTDLVGAAALCTVLLQAERLAWGHWRDARRGPAAVPAAGPDRAGRPVRTGRGAG